MPENVKLIEFENEAIAKGLTEHLKAQGIDVELNVTSQQYAFHIVLVNLSQSQQAISIVQHFLKNPQDSVYRQFAPQPQLLFGLSAFKQTPLTWLILLLCALVFVFTEAGGTAIVNQYFKAIAIDSIQSDHQWWRLFTPSFIHFSALHIILNAVVWWQLARVIEFQFSPLKLLLIFIVTSFASNIAQLLSSGVDPSGISNFGGLSGVVYGLIGFVWVCGLMKSKSGLKLPAQFIVIALGWMALGYLDLLWVSMANEAHLFGFISGMLMAIMLEIYNRK